MENFERRKEEFRSKAVLDQTTSPELIDMHTHIGQVQLDKVPVTAERLIEYMDRHNVDKAIVLPLESPESSSYMTTTRQVLQAADIYPSRLVPFCSIDPRTFDIEDEERYYTVLEGYVERGAVGFGEVKCGLTIDHRKMRLLYSLCSRYELPILLHIDEKRCMDDVYLPKLERMVRKFSDVDFILHAHGWWAHISSDVKEADMAMYPDQPVQPDGRCDQLLTDFDNLYADFSMWSGFNALTRDRDYGETFLKRHHSSLLFGTDYLYPGQQPPQFGFFEEFDLETHMWEDICYKNARRLVPELAE